MGGERKFPLRSFPLIALRTKVFVVLFQSWKIWCNSSFPPWLWKYTMYTVLSIHSRIVSSLMSALLYSSLNWFLGCLHRLTRNNSFRMNQMYSYNEINKSWIEISQQIWRDIFSNMTKNYLTNLNRSKIKQHKTLENKKFTLNSWLQTYQVLTKNDQLLVLRLSYFITTVLDLKIR